MHVVEKWQNILKKSCDVNIARFLKYVLPFFDIIHERIKIKLRLTYKIARLLLIFNEISCLLTFNPFLTKISILYRLETPENYRFYGFFKEHKIETLARNELM